MTKTVSEVRVETIDNGLVVYVQFDNSQPQDVGEPYVWHDPLSFFVQEWSEIEDEIIDRTTGPEDAPF